MIEKILNKSIFEVPDGFTNSDEWMDNYMAIRKEAIKRKVNYPVILGSVKTGRVYVFEGKPIRPIDKPIYA